ncbi:MAG: EamA family transporter [Clostridia bacterium]|jgi:drug/metabolite transporter (DMT)-like permease|nr:EamA family transporter [Clostridia bacterium]
MNNSNKSLLEIHLAVFLFGVSGLFGKLLSLPSIIIVLGRVCFSSLFLLLLLLYIKQDIKLKEKKHYLYFIIMGVILAIHWTTFFQSIQVSTVAIGLLSFSTFPVFVTFLEPYFFKENIKLSNIVVAIITFLGIVLVIPSFEFGNSVTQGVIWGLVSGFTYGILSVLNKKYVKEYPSSVIAFYEQFIAAIILIPFYFLQKPIIQTNDILLLALLGVVFTGISHLLFINSLKDIKAQTAGIISSLEPVYGIVFAAFLLSEIPSLREVLGGIVILSAVFYSTFKSRQI